MPKHEPNDITRAKVKAWAEWLPTEIIRKRLGIGSRSTLYKYYSEELQAGRVERDIEVVKALHENAINGNVTAQIFWCKTKLGMHDSPTAAVDEAYEGEETEAMTINFEVAEAKGDIRVTKGK